MRSLISVPVNTTSEFSRGTSGSVLSAPDPVSLVPADQQITVSWTKDTTSQGYRVFYHTASFSDYTDATRISITDPDTNSYVITGLDNGVTYYVRVVTVNGAGYSELTTETSAVPALYSNTLSCTFDGLTERAGNSSTADFDFTKTDTWSFSCWVKFPVGALTGDNCIVSSLNVGANYEGLEINFLNAVLRCYFVKNIGGDYILTTATSGVTENSWFHIVVTYSGSNAGTGFKYYVNSVNKATTVSVAGPISGTMNTWGNFTVGSREDGTKPLEAWVDEVAFYNKELSIDEVEEIYNSGSPNKLDSLTTSNNIISWWRMGDNDIASTLYDSVGSNDLTTVNMTIGNYVEEVP